MGIVCRPAGGRGGPECVNQQPPERYGEGASRQVRFLIFLDPHECGKEGSPTEGQAPLLT